MYQLIPTLQVFDTATHLHQCGATILVCRDGHGGQESILAPGETAPDPFPP